MIISLGILGGLVVAIFLLVLILKFILDRKTALDLISSSAKTQNVTLIKKMPVADLENYRFAFFRIGLILALGMAILAFSWTSYDKHVQIEGEILLLDDFEIEQLTSKRDIPEPPAMEVKIEIKADDEIIEEEIEIEALEIDADSEIDLLDIDIEEEVIQEDDAPVVIAEVMPEFPGGERALMEYLARTPYSDIAKGNDIQGTVYVRFVIDKNGEVTDVSVVRGADRNLDKAAVQHVRKMPNWTPGKQRGKPVKVQFVVPIRFVLD